ncbi:MAG: polysaccharide biosynthesis C-terminal domain-containing protein [Chitinophagales bacterium]|nr:polysaccharide biosynthesis C-terminal domain-containing protein [Chitinophagales bacterium]
MKGQIVNTLFARAASTFLNFLIALVIARHAGPEVKGEVTLLITTVWFVLFFSNVLGGPVLVYVVPRSSIEKLLVPAYLWSVLVSLVALAFLYWFPTFPVSMAVPVAAIGLLSSLAGIHQTVLLAKKEINKSNFISLLPLALQTAGVLLCFYVLDVHDVNAYIYASLAAYAIAGIFSGVYIRNYVGRLQVSLSEVTAELVKLFQHGFMYQLVEILQLLNLRYYFFQLGLQQGNKYLGIYSIGISILESVWLIPRSMATVHYVSTSNTTEIEKEKTRTIRLAQISFIACGAALLLIWLVPNEVYVYVFGKGFSDVKHSVRFLYPGIWVYSVWHVLGSYYFGTGNYKPLLLSNLAGVVVLMVSSAFLIPQYVMSGAGLAATLSFAAATGLLVFYFGRELNR